MWMSPVVYKMSAGIIKSSGNGSSKSVKSAERNCLIFILVSPKKNLFYVFMLAGLYNKKIEIKNVL